MTHFDDGPLLLFPFDFQYRFVSPVSYWDPAHYGSVFMPFEALLNLVLTVALIRTWWSDRKSKQSGRGDSGTTQEFEPE